MKRILLAIVVCIVSATSASAFNWKSRSAYNAEMRQQTARIVDGRRSGALSAREHGMDRRQLNRISTMGYNSTAKRMLSRHSKQVNYHKTN